MVYLIIKEKGFLMHKGHFTKTSVSELLAARRKLINYIWFTRLRNAYLRAYKVRHAYDESVCYIPNGFGVYAFPRDDMGENDLLKFASPLYKAASIKNTLTSTTTDNIIRPKVFNNVL